MSDYETEPWVPTRGYPRPLDYAVAKNRCLIGQHLRLDGKVVWRCQTHDRDTEQTAGGGEVCPVSGCTHETRSRKMPTRAQLEAEIERHRAAADRAAERLTRLEARLAEPTGYRGEAPVIRFDVCFKPGPSQVFEYAAIKAGNGLWYTTGPRSPKAYTWDELMDWLELNLVGKIWQAVEMDQVT